MGQIQQLYAEPVFLSNGAASNVCFGSWSCGNTLAEALTPRDFGEVGVLGHFAELGGSSVWKCS